MAEDYLSKLDAIAEGRSVLNVTCLSDVEESKVSWLWDRRFALGKLSIISGDQGRGKSLITIYMAAVVSRGWQWPCEEGNAPQGDVLLLSAEDAADDTIKPRINAAGGDVSRIHVAGLIAGSEGQQRSFSIERDCETLRDSLSQLQDCRLVIIDPISAYMGSADSHNNSDVRGLLAHLSDIAAESGVAIVVVSHLNKSQGPIMYRTMGSLAFVAAARAAYVVADDPKDGERRILYPLKNNLGDDRSGFRYRIGENAVGIPTLDWDTELIEGTAEEVFGDGEASSKVQEAVIWLGSRLSEGPRGLSELQAEAEAYGLSQATLRRAKTELDVRSRKLSLDGGWTWHLPDHPPHPD